MPADPDQTTQTQSPQYYLDEFRRLRAQVEPGSGDEVLKALQSRVQELFMEANRLAPQFARSMIWKHQNPCEDAVKLPASVAPNSSVSSKMIVERLSVALDALIRDAESYLVLHHLGQDMPGGSQKSGSSGAVVAGGSRNEIPAGDRPNASIQKSIPGLEHNTIEQDRLRNQLANMTRAYEEVSKRVQAMETENRAVAALKRELEQLRLSESKAQERLQAEIEKGKEFARRAFELQKELQPLKEQLGMQGDITRIVETLRMRRTRFPQSLADIVLPLLTVADHLQQLDREWLLSDAGIRCLDQSVYGVLAPFGRLAPRRGGKMELGDLILVITLQERMHTGLQGLGVNIINPAIGDAFDARFHLCPDMDLVWINDNAVQHNKIAGVKRIGYGDGSRVIRKAEVKRYMYHSTKEASPMERIQNPDPQREEPTVREGSASMQSDPEADLLAQTLRSKGEF